MAFCHSEKITNLPVFPKYFRNISIGWLLKLLLLLFWSEWIVIKINYENLPYNLDEVYFDAVDNPNAVKFFEHVNNQRHFQNGQSERE